MPVPKKPIKERLNHNNVVWKYCRLNGDNLDILDEKPTDGKPITALLPTSMWPASKVFTPQILQRMVKNILDCEVDGHNPDIYVAFPCRANAEGKADIEYMEEYYGKSKDQFEKEGVKAGFVAAYMHDDLRKGAFEGKSKFPGFLTNIPSLPAKEGAEQLVSAILEEFHCIFSIVGGNTMFPKAVLAEEYLKELAREGKIDFSKMKSHFAGFSNASIMQFDARGLLIPLHSHGAHTLFSMDKVARETISGLIKVSEMSVDSANDLRETVSKVLRVMERKKEEVTRSMPASPEMLSAIQNRINEFGDDIKINNLPFFPYLFGLTFNSKFPKFADNEKLILNIEGFSPAEKGCGASDVLFRALECGAIKREQILFISIEDLTRFEQIFKVEKVNGVIPVFDDLSESEQNFITKKAEDSNVTVDKYIEDSNHESADEYQRIRAVADSFGIPVIDGGAKRIGHSKIPSIQPKTVDADKIIFDSTSGQIIIKSLMGLSEKREEGLFATSKKSVDCTPPRWDEFEAACAKFGVSPDGSPADSYKYDKALVNASLRNENGENLVKLTKISQLNTAAIARQYDELEEEIVVGNVLNITDVDPNYFDNKGIFMHCSSDAGSPGAGYQIFDSNQLENAKFLIFSILLPEDLDPASKEQYVENRNDIFRKFFEDTGVEVPIYITTSENELNLTNRDFPGVFSARINLQEMIVSPDISLDAVTIDSVENQLKIPHREP